MAASSSNCPNTFKTFFQRRPSFSGLLLVEKCPLWPLEIKD
jgi:hypothetical protein